MVVLGPALPRSVLRALVRALPVPVPRAPVPRVLVLQVPVRALPVPMPRAPVLRALAPAARVTAVALPPAPPRSALQAPGLAVALELRMVALRVPVAAQT
ncbi:hypothetical protein [Amycolatopsis eburnea]|uniref:Uncharacterized protein n=1 Tax=Amycolatopsis eburnea TaxID=2267691 RepID=A0A427T2S7_9PSEU|nr:hypothetical protein [Amycolatopsis eburnea]RSD12023.1 hypothetical protein EIY87_35425 [Amycolatopsis eburnea]